MPKGLADVTLEFGGSPRRFQLDEKSPKLFGFGIHLDRIDHDMSGIKLYRYRETTLKVRVVAPAGKAQGKIQVQAHYVREQAMAGRGRDFRLPATCAF